MYGSGSEHTVDNLSYIKGLVTLFVQEIDNMEHITSHTHKHLKHINTQVHLGLWPKPQGQTLVWTRAHFIKDAAC